MDQNPYSVSEQSVFESDGLQGPKFHTSVRRMQVVATALIMGVLMFLGIVLVVAQGDLSGKPGLLTMIGAGNGFLMIVIHFAIPKIVANSQLKQAAAAGMLQMSDEEKTEMCCGIYQGQMIIGLALLEGAAFLSVVAMMTEKCVASLAVVILLLCLMTLRFPTETKVSWWVQNKLRELSM